jgi:hypothetical protein
MFCCWVSILFSFPCNKCGARRVADDSFRRAPERNVSVRCVLASKARLSRINLASQFTISGKRPPQIWQFSGRKVDTCLL